MKHLAAYFLLVAGGNASPSADDIKTLLGTAGIDCDEERLTQLMGELEGKDLQELLEAGKEKLFVGGMGGGGGGGAAAGGAAAGGAPAAEAPKEEAPKEEEVDALDGGMDMFGGGGGGGGDY